MSEKFVESEYIREWAGVSSEKSRAQRESNFNEYIKCMQIIKKPYWLFGRTLLYAFKAQFLTDDPYDEVGAWFEDFTLGRSIYGLKN